MKRIISLGLMLALNLCVFSNMAVIAQRDRVVPSKSQPKQTSTPSPKASPTPVPTQKPTINPTQTISPTLPVLGATPTPTPVPTPFPPAKAVDELQAQIREVLNRPTLLRSQVGIKVASLDTGKVLFENNAEKLYMPASNMKAYTVAAALDRLTPDYRFLTLVTASSAINSDGVIKGNLTITGSGDPTFSASLNNGDYWKNINELASRIAAKGVKKIEGDIIGYDWISDSPLGFGWEADDLQSYYGAPVSALTINDNAIDVFVKPGGKPGDPCVITTGPSIPLQIVNKTVTVKSGIPRRINITRKLGQDVIEVEGIMPVDDARGYTGNVSVYDPALVFVYMLRSALEQKGITVKGQSRTVKNNNDGLIETMRKNPNWLEQPYGMGSGVTILDVARIESPPLSEIAARAMKPSQNLYTEIILRALGTKSGQYQEPKDILLNGKKSGVSRGIDVVKQFLKEAGIPEGSVEQYDGSGLSRHNLITASATVQLYTYMSRHRFAQAFRDSLPIAGVDGTLRTRMRGTPAAGNARAKTGTINQVSALSGYVTTASGERLVFSILVNNLPEDSSVRRVYIDDIVVLLAMFTGKS